MATIPLLHMSSMFELIIAAKEDLECMAWYSVTVTLAGHGVHHAEQGGQILGAMFEDVIIFCLLPMGALLGAWDSVGELLGTGDAVTHIGHLHREIERAEENEKGHQRVLYVCAS